MSEYELKPSLNKYNNLLIENGCLKLESNKYKKSTINIDEVEIVKKTRSPVFDFTTDYILGVISVLIPFTVVAYYLTIGLQSFVLLALLSIISLLLISFIAAGIVYRRLYGLIRVVTSDTETYIKGEKENINEIFSDIQDEINR